MHFFRFALLLTLVASIGCATMFASKSATVEFDSCPQGQILTVSGQEVKTPGSIVLASDKSHQVLLPDGTTMTVEQTGNGWTALNLFWIPLPGALFFIIDIASGATSRGLRNKYVFYEDGKITDRKGKELDRRGKKILPPAPARKPAYKPSLN